MGRHRYRYQPPSFVPENDQNEKQPKADRRHDQEVHRTDAGRKVFHVCDRPRPLLAMYLATVDCATSIPSFSNSPWMRGAPHSRLARTHFSDQTADLPWYPRPTAQTARLPAPIQTEPRPMPPDNRLRLDNRYGGQHRRKQAIEPDEEQSVRRRQPRPRGYALTQHTQLMPQQHDLGFQPRLRLERRDQDVEEQDYEPDHCASA